MKITPYDYETLRIAMRGSALENAHTERQRWDALNAAVDRSAIMHHFVYGTLYRYLNDANIDAALKHIVAAASKAPA